MRHVGLFGGTFNPIHSGHVGIIREIRDKRKLDEIILIPSAIPPHKPSTGVAAREHRLAMARIAVAESPGMETFTRVSDIELKRKGPSYTIDTVRHFRNEQKEKKRHFLVMGADAFLEIDTWKSYMELLSLVPVIVAGRPVSPQGENTRKLTARIEKYIHLQISKEYFFSETEQAFCHPRMPSVFLCFATFRDISSSAIRQMLKNGEDTRALLPEGVARYIENKGLYR